MANLALKTRRRSAILPPAGTPIDWHSSQAQGLKFFAPMNGVFTEMMKGYEPARPYQFVANPYPLAARNDGLAAWFDTNAYNYMDYGIDPSYAALSPTGLTVCLSIVNLNNGWSNQFITKGITAGQVAAPFFFNCDYGTDYTFFFGDGTAHSYVHTTTAVIPLYVVNRLVLTYDKIAGYASIYCGSTKVSNYVGSINLADGGTALTLGSFAGGAYVASWGSTADVRVYNRPFSDADAAEYLYNPAAVFWLPKRRIFSLPTFNPAWARSCNQIIGVGNVS